MSASEAERSAAELLAAERVLERALSWRAIPDYSPGERWALAILAADVKARGRMSKSAAKIQAEYRRNHVNLILRYVINTKHRENAKAANSLNTVMTIVDWLDAIGIEASETQVRRDIKNALDRGPLPSQ